MATSKLRGVAVAAILVAGGCAGHDASDVAATTTGTTTGALAPLPPVSIASTEVYVELEYCDPVGSGCAGGYWVHEVNRDEGVRLVSSLDVSQLGSAAMEQAAGGGKELIFRGVFGPKGGPLGQRSFLVREGWRGLPGAEPAPLEDRYVTIETTDDGLSARLLNSRWERSIETVSVSGAAARLVDTAWLTSRVLDQGALVAGRFDGSTFAAGQVFVRLPDVVGPCPKLRRLSCEGDEAPTYARDENRCRIPAGCVVRGFCPMYMPVCDAGYTRVSWPGQPAACPAYACDPAFLTQ